MDWAARVYLISQEASDRLRAAMEEIELERVSSAKGRERLRRHWRRYERWFERTGGRRPK